MPNINSELWCLLNKVDLVGAAAETRGFSFVVHMNELFSSKHLSFRLRNFT